MEKEDTRIHAFDENCSKASTDKAKQSNWNKYINGHCCLEWSFKCELFLSLCG